MGRGDGPVEPPQVRVPHLRCLSEFCRDWKLKYCDKTIRTASNYICVCSCVRVRVCVSVFRVTRGWTCTLGGMGMEMFTPHCRDTLVSSGNTDSPSTLCGAFMDTCLFSQKKKKEKGKNVMWCVLLSLLLEWTTLITSSESKAVMTFCLKLWGDAFMDSGWFVYSQWPGLVLVRARGSGHQLCGHLHLHLGHQVKMNEYHDVTFTAYHLITSGLVEII